MRISVVIPVLNGEKTLGGQLAALADEPLAEEIEVIVSDNGSKDGTLQVARAWAHRFRKLRALDSSDRRGPAHARNIGALAADGDALLFCDADDVISTGWVGAMVGALNRFDLVGGGSDLTKLNSRRAIRYRPRNPRGAEGLPIAFGKYGYAPGNSLAIRKRTFQAVGGFDESLVTGEDVDFSIRVQDAGYSVGLAEGATVHYRLRPDLCGTVRQFYFYGYHGARVSNARGQGHGAALPRDFKRPFLARVIRAATHGHVFSWPARAAFLLGETLGKLAATKE